MEYSIIIPVYNRPDEADELLGSIVAQGRSTEEVEVIVVEDGSAIRCDNIVAKYAECLNVSYYYKDNSGPGQTRNYGAERASGEWLLILDSDAVLPPGYLDAIDSELQREDCDAFGGPDRASKDFSVMQKAINYAMTSFFTTGGIRGGKKKMDRFYPRSFNMGIRAEVYKALGGFSAMRFGEDIDLSLRIYKGGYRCRLFPEAWVWHKRRTDLKKFFKQVHNSGIARINLHKRHPGSLKVVHLLPAVFTVGCGLIVLCSFVWPWLLLLLLAYALIIFADAAVKEHSVEVGITAVPAAFVQLWGYGSGFIRAAWLRCVCKRNEELQAFKDNFYK
ncbi:MAG: glycosyltransferase [Prevotellaceae bacterium]|nr:glycosyltransferase [Prevotellaceae bacterium]